MALFNVSVIGASDPDERTMKLAYRVGQVVARLPAVLICGGLGGVMEWACKGAKEVGGLTVGIIPQVDKSFANKYVDVVISTGMGYARNVMVAYSGDVVVALPGQYGTLSEIAFALSVGKRVFGIGTWAIPGVEMVESVEELEEKLREMVR